jgi:hypothetical protein
MVSIGGQLPLLDFLYGAALVAAGAFSGLVSSHTAVSLRKVYGRL